MNKEADDEDMKNAMAHLQAPRQAKLLADLVADTLARVHGYDVLSEQLQRELAQACAAMYGAGYVVGMRRRG